MADHPHSRYDFDRLAGDYARWYEADRGRLLDRVQKEDLGRLLGGPQPGAELLDTGCGTGHWSAFFAGQGCRVTGVDLSPAMLAAAPRVPGTVGYLQAAAQALPFAAASFDLAATVTMLEFLPDPAQALGEMSRCLRPGGALLVGTLNRSAPLNQERLARGREPYRSARLLAPDELCRLLAPLGRVRLVASTPDRQGEIHRCSFGAPPTGELLSGPLLAARVDI